MTIRTSAFDLNRRNLAIFDAQEWPFGVGLETKLSTTAGQRGICPAIRLGAQFDAIGTARLSVTE